MKTEIKVTNQDLYNERVIDVDTSDLKSTDNYNGMYNNFCANGHISIELINGDWIEATGEHGARDYEDEYGFVLINE